MLKNQKYNIRWIECDLTVKQQLTTIASWLQAEGQHLGRYDSKWRLN